MLRAAGRAFARGALLYTACDAAAAVTTDEVGLPVHMCGVSLPVRSHVSTPAPTAKCILLLSLH